MPESVTSNGQISIFISYAREDERLCKRLITHLSSLKNEGIISHWSDSEILAGQSWDETIRTQLTSAKIILLLVSADFLASEYVNKVELPTATARHKAGEAVVIPVILRPSDWQTGLLKSLQALPRDGTPITNWANEDEALLAVVKGVRAVIEKLSISSLRGSVSPRSARVEQRLKVTRPKIRYFIDRYLPSLHRFLSNLGILTKPPEVDVLNNYLRDARATIENDIRHKTYIPLAGKEVSSTPLHDRPGADPFVPPLQQVIRQVVGRDLGGDSASAQIAAVNRNSRVIRNIISTLLRSGDPLILLGDPGTGKTMTLQQTALRLFDSEIKRVFPKVTLYVRLGEFYVGGRVTPEDVWRYLKASVPTEVSPYLEDLDSSGRLIVLFDGMDEMSRERYSEHTEALSIFAAARKGKTKTLFSCRITDFSPKFVHRRLVLLPFNDSQIGEYLRRYISSFPLTIEGEPWTLKRLVKQILRGTLPLEATNPFVLWLLCFQLQQKGSWPRSRVELLRFYIEENYRRKSEDMADDEIPFPPVDQAIAGWSKFAYTITNLNRGAAIAVPALVSENGVSVEELIRVGKRCGVLQESLNEEERQIRFEHHRFQEFFTASYINQHQTEIEWLDKLDAPRWQETMVNLILLGGGADAIATLVEAIEKEIKPLDISAHASESPSSKHEPDKSEELEKEDMEKFSPQSEALVADRIELASRIVRQASSSSTVVSSMLTDTFERAIRLLSQHGNPITQVKMMRACQNVPQIDIFQVLQNSLTSPINWVKDQALIIVSSSKRDPLAIGSHFSTQLGYDLANGTLPLRFKAYYKAAAAANQKQNWSSLAFASCAFLLNFLVLSSVAGVFFWGAWKILTGPTLDFSIDLILFAVACVVLLTAAIGISLKFDPGRLWIAIISSGVVALSLVLIVWNSQSGFGPVVLFIFYVCLGVPLAIGLMGTSIALGMHSLALASYLAATARVRHSDLGIRSYFEAMLQNCGFRGSFWALASILGIVLFLAVGGGALLLLASVIFLLTKFNGLHPLVNFLMIVFVLTLIGSSVVALKRKRFIPIAKALAYLVAIIVCIPIIVRVGDWVSAEVEQLALPTTKILIVVAAAVPVLALSFMVWIFRRKLLGLFRGRKRFIVGRSISPDGWKRELTRADPDLQQLLLSQTNHQNLGLKADEFLSVLEEVESKVTEEPALSTYWEKRDRLEQVLKQERQG